MSRRDWLHIAALGGCLALYTGALAAPANPPPQRGGIEGSAKPPEEQPRPRPPATSVLPKIEQGAPTDARPENDGGAPKQSDPQLLEILPDYLQVLIGIVGLFGLFWTVRYARKAWEAAEASAKAADATYRAMIETERRQLRAYIGVEGFQFAVINRDNPTAPHYLDFNHLAVKVRNFGSTPADDVVVYATVSEMPFRQTLAPGSDFDRLMWLGSGHNPITRAYLHRDQTHEFFIGLRDVAPFWRALEKGASLTIYGRIYYRDIYKRPWSTKFCAVWEPWHHPGPRFVTQGEFNGEDQQAEPERPQPPTPITILLPSDEP